MVESSQPQFAAWDTDVEIEFQKLLVEYGSKFDEGTEEEKSKFEANQ